MPVIPHDMAHGARQLIPAGHPHDDLIIPGRPINITKLLESPPYIIPLHGSAEHDAGKDASTGLDAPESSENIIVVRSTPTESSDTPQSELDALRDAMSIMHYPAPTAMPDGLVALVPRHDLMPEQVKSILSLVKQLEHTVVPGGVTGPPPSQTDPAVKDIKDQINAILHAPAFTSVAHAEPTETSTLDEPTPRAKFYDTVTDWRKYSKMSAGIQMSPPIGGPHRDEVPTSPKLFGRDPGLSDVLDALIELPFRSKPRGGDPQRRDEVSISPRPSDKIKGWRTAFQKMADIPLANPFGLHRRDEVCTSPNCDTDKVLDTCNLILLCLFTALPLIGLVILGFCLGSRVWAAIKRKVHRNRACKHATRGARSVGDVEGQSFGSSEVGMQLPEASFATGKF